MPATLEQDTRAFMAQHGADPNDPAQFTQFFNTLVVNPQMRPSYAGMSARMLPAVDYSMVREPSGPSGMDAAIASTMEAGPSITSSSGGSATPTVPANEQYRMPGGGTEYGVGRSRGAGGVTAPTSPASSTSPTPPASRGPGIQSTADLFGAGVGILEDGLTEVSSGMDHVYGTAFNELMALLGGTEAAGPQVANIATVAPPPAAAPQNNSPQYIPGQSLAPTSFSTPGQDVSIQELFGEPGPGPIGVEAAPNGERYGPVNPANMAPQHPMSYDRLPYDSNDRPLQAPVNVDIPPSQLFPASPTWHGTMPQVDEALEQASRFVQTPAHAPQAGPSPSTAPAAPSALPSRDTSAIGNSELMPRDPGNTAAPPEALVGQRPIPARGPSGPEQAPAGIMSQQFEYGGRMTTVQEFVAQLETRNPDTQRAVIQDLVANRPDIVALLQMYQNGQR